MSLQRQTIRALIDLIQDTKSLSTTEDALYVSTDGIRLTLMVADGAPQRLKTTHSLAPLLMEGGQSIKPGRYASHLAREITARMADKPHVTPREMALMANTSLRQQLERVYVRLTAEAVLAVEPTLTPLRQDPRFIRWILPVCCYTVVTIDLVSGAVHYAHAGDTAIFACYRDGHTEQVTPDQMAQHDHKVRARIRDLMQTVDIRSRDDLAPYREELQAIDQYNGIYHNYEDEHGAPDLTVGVGVINGLPQLEHYLVEGALDADDLQGLIVASDGMFWPSPLDETPEARADRINRMGHHILAHGLRSYVQALRAEEAADSDGRRYQMFGSHDDATAAVVIFDNT